MRLPLPGPLDVGRAVRDLAALPGTVTGADRPVAAAQGLLSRADGPPDLLLAVRQRLGETRKRGEDDAVRRQAEQS